MLPLHHKPNFYALRSNPQKRGKDNAFLWLCQILVELFCDKQIIILFAPLYDDVFVVEQIAAVDFRIGGCEFLFVDRDATALGEFPHFAFRGEYGSHFGGQFDSGYPAEDSVARHFELGHALEYGEQRVFVELVQLLRGRVPEEDVRGLDGCIVVGCVP